MGINLNLYYQLGQLYSLHPCLQRHLLYQHLFFKYNPLLLFFFFNSNNLNYLISNPPFPLTWTYTPRPPQQFTLSMATKHSSSLSLESFISLSLHLLLQLDILFRSFFLPHFLGFTHLIALFSCHKLEKNAYKVRISMHDFHMLYILVTDSRDKVQLDNYNAFCESLW